MTFKTHTKKVKEYRQNILKFFGLDWEAHRATHGWPGPSLRDVPGCSALGTLCGGTRATAETLMNGCFDLAAAHEASDGWACFGLITGFTRGLRIAVNQGPHYKSCRLSGARSHPRLMSQRSSPLCRLPASWDFLTCTRALYRRVNTEKREEEEDEKNPTTVC